MLVPVLTVLFILICPLIVLIVLMQDPKGGGLAGVLGGAGGSSAFGAKTADVVMKVTVVLGIAFFLLSIVLGITLKGGKLGTTTVLSPDEAPVTAPVEAGGTDEAETTGEPPAPPAGAGEAEAAPSQSGTVAE